jgi:hypothetical protein
VGDHEPQPAVFFFKNDAENYYSFVHTIQEKERGKEKGESRALDKSIPAQASPLISAKIKVDDFSKLI